jgi:hypothetical protein
MAVALLGFVAHAPVARRSAAVAIAMAAVAGNERRGVDGAAMTQWKSLVRQRT